MKIFYMLLGCMLAMGGLFVPAGFAADVEVTVDLSTTAGYIIECDAPVERTDGTALPIEEIGSFEFHRSPDGTVYTQVGQVTGEPPACEYLEDLDALGEGLFYYRVTATDKLPPPGGRRSDLSPDRLLLTVVRVAPPRSPVMLEGRAVAR